LSPAAMAMDREGPGAGLSRRHRESRDRSAEDVRCRFRGSREPCARP
jgi:hypothetical protein